MEANQYDPKLNPIFKRLQNPQKKLEENSTLVLLDVDNMLITRNEQGDMIYNDYLINNLKYLAHHPNVVFCLFTKMDLKDIDKQVT